MVERIIDLDNIFKALSDSTRRDILRRVAETSLSISDLAESYKMSFAAIAKHVGVLERAKLIVKNRDGKQQIITAEPRTLTLASEHLERYEQLWEKRFDNLETLLKK